MSLVPEYWETLGRDTDDHGCPVAYVGRTKWEQGRVLTVWKLVKRPNGWYNMGQWISKGTFRVHNGHDARTRPLKLSDSRIDTILKTYAES